LAGCDTENGLFAEYGDIGVTICWFNGERFNGGIEVTGGVEGLFKSAGTEDALPTLVSVWSPELLNGGTASEENPGTEGVTEGRLDRTVPTLGGSNFGILAIELEGEVFFGDDTGFEAKEIGLGVGFGLELEGNN